MCKGTRDWPRLPYVYSGKKILHEALETWLKIQTKWGCLLDMIKIDKQKNSIDLSIIDEYIKYIELNKIDTQIKSGQCAIWLVS